MKHKNGYILRTSFHRKINLAVTIFTILCILIIGYILADFENKKTVTFWNGITRTLSDLLRYPVLLKSQTGTSEIIDRYTDKDIISVAVFDNDNKLVFSKNYQGCIDDDKSTIKYLIDFISKGRSSWCFNDVIYQSSNMEKNTKAVVGHFVIEINKRNYYQLISFLFPLISFIITIFSFCITIVIRRESSAYLFLLQNIANVLSRVKNNERGIRLTVSGDSESDLISRTLNSLIKTFENNEIELERIVNIRTEELKTALINANAANELKTNMMRTVTHELRTPLNSLFLYFESVLDNLHSISDDTFIDLTKLAYQKTKSMNAQIDSFLLRSSQDSKVYKVQYSQFNLRDLIKECCSSYDKSTNDNGNILILDGEDIDVISDRTVLFHILNNLLSNAYKFTKKGYITVRWFFSENKIIFEVHDTGCGIDDKDKESIFDDFTQILPKDHRKQDGFGVGLSIVANFLNIVKGNIEVIDNINSDSGSIFKVIIPTPSKLPSNIT